MLWHGAPHALLEHVRAGTFGLVSSPALQTELELVIGRAKFEMILTHSNTSREQMLAEAWQLAEVIEPPPLAIPVCRDPDDDAVLALGLAAQVDLTSPAMMTCSRSRTSKAFPSPRRPKRSDVSRPAEIQRSYQGGRQ